MPEALETEAVKFYLLAPQLLPLITYFKPPIVFIDDTAINMNYLNEVYKCQVYVRAGNAPIIAFREK